MHQTHCSRCGEYTAEHRKLCDECRKVALVSQQSLDWIEDQLRSIERLVTCLHGRRCLCCGPPKSRQGVAIERQVLSGVTVGFSVLSNARSND